jgi:hypothetical protein
MFELPVKIGIICQLNRYKPKLSLPQNFDCWQSVPNLFKICLVVLYGELKPVYALILFTLCKERYVMSVLSRNTESCNAVLYGRTLFLSLWSVPSISRFLQGSVWYQNGGKQQEMLCSWAVGKHGLNDSRIRFPVRAGIYSLLHSVHMGSGTHQASSCFYELCDIAVSVYTIGSSLGRPPAVEASCNYSYIE